MGILDSAKPVILICARDRAHAIEFYRDTLGLNLSFEDKFAAVFDIASRGCGRGGGLRPGQALKVLRESYDGVV